MRDEKGAISIVGLVMAVFLIILFAWLSPILNDAISYAKSYIADPIALMILDMLPFFLLLGILASWVIYSTSK